MFKQACTLCKIVGVFAVIGCLNWGLIGLFGFNLVVQIFGQSGITRFLYILVGISGLLLLISYFYICPKCKKS